MDELFKQLKILSEKLGRLGTTFIRGHALWLIGSAVLVLICVFTWEEYSRHSIKEVELLVGPWGGDDREYGRRIQELVQRELPEIGTKYRLTLRGTSGYEENRRRLNADQSGNMIGFAHDGFGDKSNLAILVPLEWAHLHILCATPLYEQAKAARDQKRTVTVAGVVMGENPPPLTFKDVAQILHGPEQRGKAFVGLPESGTRQAAEIVLRHYGLDPEELSTNGVSNWNEVRAALLNGSISIAFCSASVGAQNIQTIANDKRCVLIGLNGSRDAILQGRSYLAPGTFEKDAYQANGFCPGRLETIATRTVLACSAKMTDPDGFFFSSNATRALSGIMDIRWDTKPPGEVSLAEKPFSYNIHPGAKLVKDNTSPSKIWSQFNFILPTFGIWFLLESLRWTNRKLPGTQDSLGAGKAKDHEQAMPGGAGASPQASYEDLCEEISKRVDEIGSTSLDEGRSKYREWLRDLVLLKARIGDISGANKLDPKDKALLSELADELRKRIDAFRPPERKTGGAAAEPAAV